MKTALSQRVGTTHDDTPRAGRQVDQFAARLKHFVMMTPAPMLAPGVRSSVLVFHGTSPQAWVLRRRLINAVPEDTILQSLPEVYPNDDGTSTVEWVAPNRRLTFFLEGDDEESGWALAFSQPHLLSNSALGPLDESTDIEALAQGFLTA